MDQMLALRRKHLPTGDDSEDDLARAIWLERQYWTNQAAAITNGIVKAFKG